MGLTITDTADATCASVAVLFCLSSMTFLRAAAADSASLEASCRLKSSNNSRRYSCVEGCALLVASVGVSFSYDESHVSSEIQR